VRATCSPECCTSGHSDVGFCGRSIIVFIYLECASELDLSQFAVIGEIRPVMSEPVISKLSLISRKKIELQVRGDAAADLVR
jgi:hypothetical protein